MTWTDGDQSLPKRGRAVAASKEGSAQMEFEKLQKNWDAWGRTDPLFAILTNDAQRRWGGWDLAEFFATGEKQIEAHISFVRNLPGAPVGGRILDFGCGIGRLTQAFCHYFDECDGVDIAQSMIEQARQHNRHGARCRYHVNVAQDLRLFPDATFDFVYTSAVLQHMIPRYAKGYIREFFRVLKPGGMTCFELPSHLAISDPLPPRSFRARITLLDVPQTMRTNVPVQVQARVRNESEEVWPSFGRDVFGPDLRNFLNLGNHWEDKRGKCVVRDDGRTSLTEVLHPGEECTVFLEVRPPRRPGRYVLELDMVHEGHAWFKDRGSSPARIAVRVDPAHSRWERLVRFLGRARPRARGKEFEPVMEMHCVPKPEVLDLIEDCGGKLVTFEEMHASHYGYRYYATR